MRYAHKAELPETTSTNDDEFCAEKLSRFAKITSEFREKFSQRKLRHSNLRNSLEMKYKGRRVEGKKQKKNKKINQQWVL